MQSGTSYSSSSCDPVYSASSFLLPEEDVEISYEPLLNLVYLWQWWNFGILRSLDDEGQYCFWELTDTTFGITCFLDDEGTGCPH